MQKALCRHLSNTEQLPTIIQRRLSRALAHFNVKTQIIYSEDTVNRHTQLFLITNDRPGLLAIVSRVFLNLSIHLHNAKIATAGERVEDMFYITNQSGLPLTPEEQEQVKHKLLNDLLKNGFNRI